MGGVMAGIFLLVITAALLVYTSYRTLHFFSQTLPGGQAQILGYFALAAFDVGLIVWACLYYFQAYGATQRAISMIMIGVSVLGIVLALFADTLLTSNDNGLTKEKPDDAFFYTVIVAMALIIALNIVATISYHLSDPSHKERVGKEQLRAGVRDGVLRQLEEQKEEMISRITPIVAAHEIRQLEANIIAELQGGSKRLLAAPAPATKKVLAPPAKAKKLAPIRAMAQEPNSEKKRTRIEQPTAEQVVERYAPEPVPEETPYRSYAELKQEEEEEEASDFLSRDGSEIPIRSRGELLD
jgi:hypothetical protein